MNYKKLKDRIIIYDTSQFNPEHILECGQIFRFQKNGDNYIVFSKDKRADIVKIYDEDNSFHYEILTTDINYFENFFDLQTDYNSIKLNVEKLAKNKQFIKNSIQFGSGIRILKQEPFEATICFVISQNNNIKRIQQLVEKICKDYGKNMGDYYAFPTVKNLLNVTEQNFKELGAGYRASYLVNAIKFFSNFDFESFKKCTYVEMEKTLLSVKGVGQKVCDCIMLFGYHNMSYFPVDTWIEKVYKQYFAATRAEEEKEIKDRIQIRNQLVKIFGSYSGYAQQYLFYYQRSKKK